MYNEKIKSIPMPSRIKALPVSETGYPVPWFVQWMVGDMLAPVGIGRPEFRVMDSQKYRLALKRKLHCWVCGQQMGTHKVFVIGPMCVINRVTSEPPCHRDCAEYAAKACPFLVNPRMRRNEKNLPEGREIAGFHLDRNPGVMALYQARDFKVINAGNGVLLRLDAPERVDWVKEGRPATREEVEESVAGGLPELRRMAKLDGPEGISELDACIARYERLLPARAAA